ncbi:hypothetical protein LAZ67_20001774 [Cordylochernes scorpioides]|uniref:BACK domain-containing protein n=1 Tax=Cordylochernes scorpioides TaxID=51811 RepID=A0ABY6LP69_9ARAC|nr:hypothetical protein LAZ67_20001774 [Cordylochernes scorpioides]
MTTTTPPIGDAFACFPSLTDVGIADCCGPVSWGGSGLAEDLKFLASMPELCDVTFLVGDAREPVCAVKAVLGARSKVFHKMLYQPPSPSPQHRTARDSPLKKKESLRESRLKLFAKRSSEPILNLPASAQRSAIGRSTNQAKRRREYRASETSEQRQARQERDRVHTALARSLETSEQSQARQERDRVHTALARSLETSEQSQARQERERGHTALARSLETSEQSQARQERDRVHTALARSLETSKQSQERQERDRVHTALARSLETSEQSQARQERERGHTALARSLETSEQSQARQERDRVHTALARSLETSEQSQARQERDRVHTALARSLETSEQSQARQERDRIRRTQTMRTMHTDLNLCGYIYNPYYNFSLHPSVIIGKMDKKCTYIVVLKNLKMKHQIYFMGNTDEQINRRCQLNVSTKREIVTELQNLFKQHNELIKLFKTAIEQMPSDDYKVIIKADKTPIGQHRRQFNAPTIDEVAIVIVGEEFNSRDIILHRRNGGVQKVSETHRSYDALQYPILFWQGEDGYHFNINMRNPTTNVDINKKGIGKMVILPSTFTGSLPLMHEYAQDAMTYVRAYGRPDFFITFTCNPAWDEIKELLLTGQSPSDRHDISAPNKSLTELGMIDPNRSGIDILDRDIQGETHFDVNELQAFVRINLPKLDSLSTHQTLIVEEFEPDVFRQLIEYIHTGCVTLQARTLLGLMNAADYYGLDELRKACLGFVHCCINVDTVCALLASAEKYIQYKCTKSLVQKSTMTAKRHVNDVLRPVTLSYLHRVPNALYQHDNARPHKFYICFSGQRTLLTSHQSSMYETLFDAVCMLYLSRVQWKFASGSPQTACISLSTNKTYIGYLAAVEMGWSSRPTAKIQACTSGGRLIRRTPSERVDSAAEIVSVLEYVDHHGNEVLSLGSFALLPEHVVRLILSREELRADELTKFQAAVFWSRRASEKSPQSLRETVASFLECIEFFRIPAGVLMREVRPLGLVPDNVLMDALAYQADPASVDPGRLASPRRASLMLPPPAPESPRSQIHRRPSRYKRSKTVSE